MRDRVLLLSEILIHVSKNKHADIIFVLYFVSQIKSF